MRPHGHPSRRLYHVCNSRTRVKRKGVIAYTSSPRTESAHTFILSIASGRAGLELIELGDTNARYRTIDDLHMVVKNRGSLVYAALAGSRSAAEDLILSAIADQ